MAEELSDIEKRWREEDIQRQWLWSESHERELTQEEALFLLRGSDHCFLRYSAAMALAQPFEFTPKIESQQANIHPKGLIMPDEGFPGEWHEGVSAEILAVGIARLLDPSYKSPYSGRGFTLRAACDHIAKMIGVEYAL